MTEIHHAYVVRDAGGEEHYGTVVVTGPAESRDPMGRRPTVQIRGDGIRKPGKAVATSRLLALVPRRRAFTERVPVEEIALPG